MIVELTLKSGKKVKFEKFGEINFGQGIKSVDSLTEHERIKLANMYRQLGAQVQREIVRLHLKGDKATTTDELRKLQLNDLKNSLAKNLSEITQSNQTAIQNAMLQTSQAVAQDMTKWFNSIGINIKTSFAHVPQDVVSNIVSGRLYGKNWNFSSRIWGDYNKSVSDITKIVAQGIAENKPTYDIAKDLESYVNPNAAKPWDWSKVYPGSKKKIDYNAQRLARTMINHAYQQSIVETCKSNPFVKGIQWRSAFSKTTCEICESLDGNIFPIGEVPLDHPNGKCTFIAVIDKSSQEIEDDLLKWVDGEADEEFNQKMELFAEKAGFTKADIDLNKIAKQKSKGTTEAFNKLQEQIKNHPRFKNMEYKQVQALDKELTTEQIIGKLAGADKTRGSCASLSLAYMGNRCGFDVIDYRDGESRTFFSCNIKRVVERINSFNYIKSTNKNEYKAVNTLFKKMEQDKEYVLITGNHAAVVRKLYDESKGIYKYQYLELQSSRRKNTFYDFGWVKADGSDNEKEIGKEELKYRFGARSTDGGASYLFSIDKNKINENDDFKTLLGYINTSADKQIKGDGGGEK